MADIVNLRAVRKAKKRAEKAHEATARRASFGMTKAEKAKQREAQFRTDRMLDGARLERD